MGIGFKLPGPGVSAHGTLSPHHRLLGVCWGLQLKVLGSPRRPVHLASVLLPIYL